MRYGSVCSGIEAASVAWESLGWEAQWYSEIEPFPSAVLAHRFPTVPNLGDMNLIHETQTFNDTTIDLLVGGTPCQSFSVAGLRKGLADPRGNLMLTFLSLAERKKPRWIVWENVPGVLSSNGGRDFATFLTALGDIGYGFAYRVLDAQYFGVAQRRRRVFVVAHLGDWRPCASVLFEQDCLSGNSKESKQKRKTTSSDAQGGSGGSGQWWNGEQIAATLTKQNANGDQRMPDKDNFGAVLQPTIIDRAAFNQGANAQYDIKITQGETMPSLVAKGPHGVATHKPPTMAIRRLTPKECERLQGFPDDWTLIPYRNKSAELCPDGPRYKACGNSMAVPVMRWIGQRIEMVEQLMKEING
jgi:DNA (cytosine-5)-methyltransferase 1